MSITPATIAAAAAAELPLFFNDTFDQFIQGEGEYIRAGNPKSISSQIGQAVARAACRRYGSGNATPNAAQAERYERACRPYLNDIGLGLPARITTPVRGGQCVGSVYNLSGSMVTNGRFCSSGSTTTQTTNIIIGFFPTLIGPVTSITTQIFGAACQGFPRGVRIVYTDLGGIRTRSTEFASEAGPIGYNTAYFFPTLTLVSGANNCGSQPVQIDPIRPGPDPTPPPFRFNPNVNVDVDINVSVALDGSITFNIGTGDITVDPFAESGGGGADVAPTTPGVAGSSVTTGSGGESESNAPAGKELTGVLVEIVASPPNAARFQNNSRQPFRGAGYISMGYPGLLGVDTSGGVFSSPQFFHAQQRGLSAWRTSANIGFNLRSTPYYREIPS